MSFAECLNTILASRGMRQTELASSVRSQGVELTESAVSLWCSGKSLPARERLAPLLAALDVSEQERQDLLHAFVTDPGPNKSEEAA